VRKFSRTVAIDWSGAKGRRHKGIAIAEARAYDAPRLIRASHGWSRQEVLDWLLREADREPTLFGFDLRFEPPLIEVLSITYIDSNGDVQTMDEADYHVVRKVGPKCRRSVIELVEGGSWPSTRLQADAVTVTYRAGYVEEPGVRPAVTTVPDDLLEGLCARAAAL
jgi:hypothetical protein